MAIDIKKTSIKAPAPGSYEETKQNVCNAIIEKMGEGYDVWLKATYPDRVIARVYPYASSNPMMDLTDKFYEIPYTDINGNINLGNAIEVQPETNYIEVSQKMKASTIVRKDNLKQLITAPVLIPDCDDCDAKRGEKQLSADEIEFMSHEFMSKHRIVDKMHDYALTQENVADIVESWQLREAQKFVNIFGQDKEYPKGTWMATTKVTDPETWERVEKGIYTGYSVTALPKELADMYSSKIEELGIVEKDRVLIKDLKNPVGYTISLVPEPCVDAKFLSLKGDIMDSKDKEKVEKAGAMFSGSNLGVLQKAYDMLGNLLNKQSKVEEKNTKQDNLNVGKSEVLDMDEKDVKAMVDESVGKMKDELIEELKSDKAAANQAAINAAASAPAPKLTPAETKTLIAECKSGTIGSCGKLAAAGVDVKSLKFDIEKMDAFKELKADKVKLETNVEELNRKLGVDPSKKSMEGQDKDKDKTGTKTSNDFYKDAGLKSSGRPLDNK